MIISSIAAVAENWVIGKNNQIPWHLPSDLKFFKKTTLGHHVIMGRKSFESIGKPLVKRTNIIVSRNPFYIVSNCFVTSSIEEALSLAFEHGEDEVFILGGGEIYTQSQALWNKLYLTRVHAEFEGDAFFPKVDFSNWRVLEETFRKADEKNPYDHTFFVYERI